MPSGRSERAQRKGNLKNGFGKVETRFEEEMTKHNRSVWFDQSIRSPCSYGAVKSFQVRLDKTRLHRLVLSEAWRRNTTYLKKKHVFVHANILVMLWKLLFLCRCLEITKKGRTKSSWHRKGTGGEKNNHSWCAKDPPFPSKQNTILYPGGNNNAKKPWNVLKVTEEWKRCRTVTTHYYTCCF